MDLCGAGSESDEVSWGGASQSDASGDARDVADWGELLSECISESAIVLECFDGVEAGVDGLRFSERGAEPMADEAFAHRCAEDAAGSGVGCEEDAGE